MLVMMWNAEQAKRLGAGIRALRHERGLSQEALAYRAGITKNQLQLIEAGRASGKKGESGPSNPRMATLVGLAAVLGVGLGEFLTGLDI